MLEKTLILSNIDDVKSFVDLMNTKEYDVEIMAGKYIVNAKSIMGIFSLDLTKPVVMVAHCGEKRAELARQVEKYTIEYKEKKEQ